MALAARSSASDSHLAEAARTLQATRPTAINLVWALTRMRTVLAEVQPKERVDVAFREAAAICEADVEQCRLIGVHGWSSSADLPKPPAEGSTFSPTVTRVGLPALIGALHLRLSTWRMTRGYPCTYGSMKPGRATRARR